MAFAPRFLPEDERNMLLEMPPLSSAQPVADEDEEGDDDLFDFDRRQRRRVSSSTLQSPPFFRMIISSAACIPPTNVPPELSEQLTMGANSQIWNDFWYKLKPILVDMDRLRRRLAVAVALVSAVWMCVVFTLVDSRHSGWIPWAVLVFAIFFCGMLAFKDFFRQPSVNEIREMCTYGVESTFFRRNGFNLAIETLPSGKLFHAPAINLFFVPTTHLCRRYEVFQGIRTWRGWAHPALAKLSLGNGLPNELLSSNSSLPQQPSSSASLNEEWSGFWRKMTNLARPLSMRWANFPPLVHMLSSLVLFAGLWYIPRVLSREPSMGMVWTVLYTLGILYVWFDARGYQHNLALKQGLTLEYAPRLAQHGIYIEYRITIDFDVCVGIHERHFVYIFFATTAPPNSEANLLDHSVSSQYGSTAEVAAITLAI